MADLITAAEYKIYASIASTESDAKLSVVVPMVSAFVKTYCNRDFANNTATDITEYYSNGGKLFYISEPPVTSITSLEQKPYPSADYVVLVDKVDYEYDMANYCFVSLLDSGFLASPNAVKVTYKGGFATTPADLKLGIISLITYYMKNESMIKKSINGNSNMQEFPQSADLPPHIKRVFDLYRIIN